MEGRGLEACRSVGQIRNGTPDRYSTMEDQITKSFVTEVMSRMRKPSGLPCGEKTTADYTRRIMTLKNMGLLNELINPENLYIALCKKYDTAASLLILLRPAGAFLGNLTETERCNLRLDITSQTLLRYSSLLTEATARRKVETMDKKRANAPIKNFVVSNKECQ